MRRCAGVAQGADSRRALLGVAALLFAASVALTTLQCASMSAMGGTRMAGGWAMSMAWTRMPGQSWAAAFGCFLTMWTVMTVAMMLPSLTPAFLHHQARCGRFALTVRMALGYFAVAATLGAAIYPLGAALAVLQMHWPSLARRTPAAAGLIVVASGLVQFTRWKSYQLACCRHAAGRGAAHGPDALSAWRGGLRLGLRCCCCCLPQTAVLLAVGVMDLRAMAVVSGTIAAERLPARGASLAKLTGAVAVGVGTLVLAHAAGID